MRVFHGREQGSLLQACYASGFVEGQFCGLLPVVGMPLPFISQGGSSLVSLFLAFGIIVSMGTHKKFLPQ